jgi:hypothetical protein
MQLDTQTATGIFNANKGLTSAQVCAALAGVKGVTFAGVDYVTDVKTAAAHKGVSIKKVTRANIQMFNELKDYDVYAKAVKRSAGKLDNDEDKVEGFTTSANWHEHVAGKAYSIVQHKKTGAEYLYAIYNGAASVYYIDGAVATKEQVAAYMTGSDAKKLLEPEATVKNVTHDIEHSVVCRTVGLDNVVQLRVNGQVVTA